LARIAERPEDGALIGGKRTTCNAESRQQSALSDFEKADLLSRITVLDFGRRYRKRIELNVRAVRHVNRVGRFSPLVSLLYPHRERSGTSSAPTTAAIFDSHLRIDAHKAHDAMRC
jgi:hypothetical protein